MDGVMKKMVKNGSETTDEWICKLHEVGKTIHVPNNWMKAMTAPLHKGNGSKHA